MPEAELIIGHDDRKGVFSKTRAFNDAFRRSHGDVIVLLDADAYYSAEQIRSCATQLRAARGRHQREWFIPYQFMYRLNQRATKRLLESNPRQPVQFTYPADPADVDGVDKAGYGKIFAALTMILPWEAVETVNRFDERFRGWGGEDVCFMRAVDLLWGKHHALRGGAFHLWHGNIGDDYDTREWSGQPGPRANNSHSLQYFQAVHDVKKMRKIVAGNRHEFRARDFM